MAISLTESAATRVKTFLVSRGHGVGLRLGVRKTGCSGFAYVINYADEATPGDLMFEDRGVKVFVDPSSISLIDGTIVDFVKQGLNEAFRFRNPNVKGECGCGESFSVESAVFRRRSQRPGGPACAGRAVGRRWPPSAGRAGRPGLGGPVKMPYGTGTSGGRP